MKKLFLFIIAGGISATSYAQSAIDAYRFSQPDMRGTARFMSMGGAFGALGGDLSTLSQNPAGIGVYRSNEVGFTLDLDAQSASAAAQGVNTNVNQTKFYLDNIGGVATLRFGDAALRNINFGFTYNKGVSFNRHYKGLIPVLKNSMTNYIAGIANGEGLTVGDVQSSQSYDPYNPNDGGVAAPWLAILGYDSYLINPVGNPDNPTWQAQFGQGTTGQGNFDVIESGSVDEYNIAIGGNIKDVVYWGMNFDIVNFDYKLQTQWEENLNNAYLYNPKSNSIVPNQDSRWRLNNYYRANGTGFNYQLGVIVKPVQEFRIGFAFHTPTWLTLTETFKANTRCRYFGEDISANTNNGTDGYQDYNFNSPWKLIFSMAGVLGNNFILSADYQIDLYKTMKFSEATNYNYGYNDYWDWDYYAAPTPMASYNDPYGATNQDIKDIYRTTNTLRVGAEYRITPSFSVRAGYSFVSSPVQAKAKSGSETIYTAGTLPNFTFDNTTNYVTCGIGYRHKGFYVDMAYVYKHMGSTYHAFTSDPTVSQYPSPSAKLSLDNNRVILSMGYKF